MACLTICGNDSRSCSKVTTSVLTLLRLGATDRWEPVCTQGVNPREKLTAATFFIDADKLCSVEEAVRAGALVEAGTPPELPPPIWLPELPQPPEVLALRLVPLTEPPLVLRVFVEAASGALAVVAATGRGMMR
jgi:hypothetical protein